MIGWEYPPFNSGGLGVACEGLTKALAGQNNQIYFTLPHNFLGKVPHMKIVNCVDPKWDAGSFDQLYGVAPFGLYEASIVLSKDQLAKKDEAMDSHALSSLPQSELEAKVDQYANMVVKNGSRMDTKFDVIHSHDWMSFPAGVALSKKTGKPLITHVHSTEHDRIPSGQGSQYIHHMEYEGMQHATRVVAVSDYTKWVLVDKYAINPDKIDVVHNGINRLAENEFVNSEFAGNRPLVVFMGRLTAQKGAPYFLALASQVLRRVPEALFVVAGDGDMYQELLFSTAYQKLSASVLFSGFVRDRQRDAILNRADVFVMPSLSEPFGLVALEAAQRHTPVIVSKNAGVSEVLPSSIALDFWDLNKMTSAIVEIIKDEAVAQKLVSKQLKDLESVTWDHSAQKLQGVYRRALIA